MPERPSPPTSAPADEAPLALPWLADQDAFVRRYVLSLVLSPPPSVRRLRRAPFRR